MKRKKVDFLDISKEDFSTYETLDLEGKPAKPSTHNIFRDSLVGDREEMDKLFLEKIPSMSPDKNLSESSPKAGVVPLEFTTEMTDSG